jgi:hypothetical protein
VAFAAFSLLATVAIAGPPVQSPDQHSIAELSTITVEAQRETLKRKVGAFISEIAVAPYEDSLARWEEPTFICPLVAGLPRDDGEFMLTRLSSIAIAAGAPVGPAKCKPNFYIVVTSQPDALLAAWTKRDSKMFVDDAGPTKIHKCLHAPFPVRVWYNAELYSPEGTPLLGMPLVPLKGTRENPRSLGFRLTRDEVRDLTSVVVLIDAGRVKGVTFGQLAAYVAMIGLAEIRLDARLVRPHQSCSGFLPPQI